MELTQAIDPEVNQLIPEAEARSPLTTDNFSTSTSVVSSPEVAVVSKPDLDEDSIFTRQQLDLVSRGISEGFSNTQIIEDILGYKGARFKQGKELLILIKQHLGVEND